MATAVAALLTKVEAIAKGVYSMEWTATVSGVGNPFIGPALDWTTVQVQGPTGGTSSISIEGTNGSVVSTATWITMESVSGETLSWTDVTGGKILSLREIPLMVRPNFATVTTAASMSVKLVARGPLR